ncbi:MAG: hypothetical protein QOG85_527 [Gaiellaceae bacterium]|jgi:hypothetical protein|nr:hypothetical protein [Gaiellaceae bacterium]
MKGQPRILVVGVWLAAAAVLIVSRDVNRWHQPPLWWLILAIAVLVPGLVVLVPGRRARRREYDSSLGWWRELPVAARPLGIWATLYYIAVIGVGLPTLGLILLLDGDGTAKVIGSVFLLLSIVGVAETVRHRRRRVAFNDHDPEA